VKKSDKVFLFISKVLAFLVRILLRVRYKITINGSGIIHKDQPVLFLPNHQAMIDPIILLSQIYRFSSAIPVISEKYYDYPVVRLFFRRWGAVRVSDLEKGSRDTGVLKTITRSVLKGFRREKNIVIYSAGQLAAQGYERIINKKSAYAIVLSLPGNVQVVGARISGLWGSMWSKAATGKPPNFFIQLLKGILYVILNGVFFLPKRRILIEFEDLTSHLKEKALSGQKEFNASLEEFYNKHGEESVFFQRYFYFLPNLKSKVKE